MSCLLLPDGIKAFVTISQTNAGHILSFTDSATAGLPVLWMKPTENPEVKSHKTAAVPSNSQLTCTRFSKFV